ALQQEYIVTHGITPETVRKNIREGIEAEVAAHRQANEVVGRQDEEEIVTAEFLSELEAEMHAAAEQLDFERAALLRDRITEIREGKSSGESANRPQTRGRGRRRGRGGRVPRPKSPGK
ncbi:MAG: UvrB/UvrC motif-containing protein, partial [Planctomycetales bacterium]|nr:UvrB/UvrC motif-containing protein [Planctomycetales bacterium]